MFEMKWMRLREDQIRMLQETEGLSVIDTKVASPDSQYRLCGCKCGSEDLAYLLLQTKNQKLWRVRCMACGTMGKGQEICHDAQIEWNTNNAMKHTERLIV